MHELSPVVRKRLGALKNLQKQTLQLEGQFHREVYDLESKFQGKHDEIYKKRSEIINGLYEPTDEECMTLIPGSDEYQDREDVPAEGRPNAACGIPNFWLTVFKSVAEIRAMIHEHDEKILKHLIDVRAFSKPSPELSFHLEFLFSPNEYFQNSILTKTYLMKCEPDADDPYTFEGPEIYKSIGCEIMWNAGQNVTEIAAATNNQQLDEMLNDNMFLKGTSFFNFFSPPTIDLDDDNHDKVEVR
jgi:hypothetical protein